VDLIYLSNSILYSKKANSIQVTNMCHEFANTFDSVTLYAYSDIPNLESVYSYYGLEKNFKIKRYLLPKGMLNKILNAVILMISIFVKKKNVVVYGRDTIMVFLCSLLGVKNVYELHSFSSSKYHYLEKYIFNSPYTLLTVSISNSLKDKYLSTFSFRNSVEVFHDSATETPIKAEDKNLDALDPNQFNIGYIGHLYQGRGIELIIEIAKKLNNFKFHIVGGEESDVKRYKLISPKNMIYHGFVSPSKTHLYRHFSDILLMPYQEGLGNPGALTDTSMWMSPMKLFEYMSSKTPIISTDLPVLREVLNEKNSILLPYNSKDWITSINILYGDPKLAKKLALNAYKDFISNYTWEKRANKISEIIYRRI